MGTKIDWDTTYSTYHWELHYKSGSQAKSDGYSKPRNKAENADKTRLLCRIIENPFIKHKYIPYKCERIVIRKKVGGMIDKEFDPIILSLTPDGYDFIDSNYVEPVVKQFLDEKYLFFKTGEMPKKSVFPPQMIKNTSNDQVYRYALNTKFLSYDDFFKKKFHLESIGIEKGMVQNFVYTIQREQRWLFQFEGAVKPLESFANPPKERKLIPAKEYISKDQLNAAVEQLKSTVDLTNIPANELKTLLELQLKKSNQNINH
jgi:hypothetical protein